MLEINRFIQGIMGCISRVSVRASAADNFYGMGPFIFSVF